MERLPFSCNWMFYALIFGMLSLAACQLERSASGTSELMEKPVQSHAVKPNLNPTAPFRPSPEVVGSFVPRSTTIVAEKNVDSDSQVGQNTFHSSLAVDSPIDELSIDHLTNRFYGEGKLKIEARLDSPIHFGRALITYPSDGLTIYGFMNVPTGEGPFPVVIFLHGYVEKGKYEIQPYSTRYADDFVEAGYVVIHPNLRGYQPSDEGENYFEVGSAIDVLNLIALIKKQGGNPGPLVQVDPNRIALVGHSTGGGIALRVITVNHDIDAAILYAPMSGDEAKNAYRTYWTFSGTTRWENEITVPEEELERISPVNYFDRISAGVQIHHGELDSYIPVGWSRETCDELESSGVSVECYFYERQAHNFCCDGYQIFFYRVLVFFNRLMK